MDHDQARARLLAERAEVADLLADAESAGQQDRETEDEEAAVYVSDAAQPLTEEGIDDAVADSMRERLATIDRALRRLDDGTYGRSVRSGLPIPDDRLEADPARHARSEGIEVRLPVLATVPRAALRGDGGGSARDAMTWRHE